MLKKFAFTCFLSLSFLSFQIPLAAEESSSKEYDDFFVLTIPKCGTHLVLKLLFMLTNTEHYGRLSNEFQQLGPWRFIGDSSKTYVSYEEFDRVMTKWKKDNRFAYAHMNFSPLFEEFSELHPEYVPLIQIRDLRDALVSYVHAQWDKIESEIGPSNFAQKLLFVLQLDRLTKETINNHYRHAENALLWVNRSDAVVIRFEDLVGEKGGGTLKQQQKQIKAIAKALGISLSKERLDTISESLFGVEEGPRDPINTFRKGQIGDWRQHFNAEHIRIFNQRWAHLQEGLGYTLD